MKYHIMATLSDGKRFSCTNAECGFRTNSRKSIGFYFDKYQFAAKMKLEPEKCCDECKKIVNEK